MSESTRELLFHELELLIRTSGKLLSMIRPEHWEQKPHDALRPIGELANHLAQIPAVDLAILREADEITVRRLEADLTRQSGEELVKVMNEGWAALKDYMSSLTEEEFFTKKTKAFYKEEGTCQATWLTEIITHLAHHRAQLFDALKQFGYGVNMFDLYA
ncbi:DinB family protein [Staphylospora marina]|uniref:DinB family protein n=1 Tax=Staphylospora marina TaxID=2490858 RepID=UPI000F5C1CF8|nr:DinB family protein [Staphylospora marina]